MIKKYYTTLLIIFFSCSLWAQESRSSSAVYSCQSECVTAPDLDSIIVLAKGCSEQTVQTWKHIHQETLVTQIEPQTEKKVERKPLFALKTNLLYDLALTPNLELEVPIGRRWSVNAEFQRGWWLRRDNTFCWQIEAAGLEGRYWFGNRENRAVLTGWFAGVFTAGGFYDFQLKRNNGYQGEFYIMTGLSGGYATPIARNLNLEFSLGVGYIVTDYRHYCVIDDELIKQGSAMRFSSFVPAKAKVSLVWMINRKVKGGAR